MHLDRSCQLVGLQRGQLQAIPVTSPGSMSSCRHGWLVGGFDMNCGWVYSAPLKSQVTVTFPGPGRFSGSGAPQLAHVHSFRLACHVNT